MPVPGSRSSTPRTASWAKSSAPNASGRSACGTSTRSTARRTFVHGVPLWGSLVGVVENGRVVAGAVSFPAVGEHVAASRGLGCLWNGEPCSVSDVADLRDATVLTTDERFSGDAVQRAGWVQLGDTARTARTWGDCYGYLLVATGRAEVMLDGRLNPWDADLRTRRCGDECEARPRRPPDARDRKCKRRELLRKVPPWLR